MHVARRVHLFLGLLLLPWVLAYGFSALCFNHGIGGRATPARDIDARAFTELFTIDDANGTAIGPASRLAAAAVERWRADGVDYRLVGDTPRFTGTFVLETPAPSGVLRLAFDPASETATVRTIAASGTPPRARLPAPSAADLRSRITALAANVDVGTGACDPERIRDWQLRSAPRLRFEAVDEHDQRHTFELPLDGSSATVRPADDDRRPLGFAAFLRRMHTTHGYRADAGVARLGLAVVVDAMGIAMVVWSLTGLLMWWQKRSLRRLGVVALAACAVVAVAIGAALWFDFTSS